MMQSFTTTTKPRVRTKFYPMKPLIQMVKMNRMTTFTEVENCLIILTAPKKLTFRYIYHVIILCKLSDRSILTVGSGSSRDDKKKSLRLLSTAYYLRHGLSKAALKDFLTLMNIAGENLPKEMRSPFTLLNPYTHLKSDIRRIYVCRKCKNLLVNGQDGYPIKLQPCGHPYARVKKHCYTLLLNIEDQLAYFLKHYGMKRRNSEDGKICDVASGSCYKELMNQLGDEAASRTITLQVNTDGAQMYESSKWNFWPFMVIINEAPYHIRRENMVLVGIHHCDSKPTEDAFVLPCVERLKMLQENGIEFENNHYNVRLLIITTDTVARPIIRNTTQFNGKFGCDFCLHPGKIQ